MTGHYESTAEDLQKIKQFSNTINEYTTLKAGETVDWEFNLKSIAQVTDNYGKQRVQFKVYDPDADCEFKWNATKTAARSVLKFLEQGKNFLRVKREGSGQSDTKYFVEEIKG